MTTEAKIATFSEAYFSEATAKVDELMSGNGQEKYGPGLKERNLTEQIESALNHIGKWKAGLDIDKESGSLHLTAASAQIQVALQHTLTKPHLDNRDKRERMVVMGSSNNNGYPYRKYPEYAEISAIIKTGGPVLESVED